MVTKGVGDISHPPSPELTALPMGTCFCSHQPETRSPGWLDSTALSSSRPLSHPLQLPNPSSPWWPATRHGACSRVDSGCSRCETVRG